MIQLTYILGPIPSDVITSIMALVFLQEIASGIYDTYIKRVSLQNRMVSI
jgi:2-phospho-L-lactate transferase/gluconeogenesis factor (CofD/UPF0052 family)